LSYLALDRNELGTYVRRLMPEHVHTYEPPPKIARIVNLIIEE